MTLPCQYQTGVAYFMDFELAVGRGTFIPRPETEILVEHVLDTIKTGFPTGKPVLILDLCTGSGNIAISLTKYVNNSKIVALDISLDAIRTAKRNAAELDVADRVTFIKSDLFGALSERNKFDIIVSNPPYINSRDMETLPDHVREEPCIALYGGIDGNDFYRKIAAQAKYFLAEEGYIFLEIGYDQGKAVSGLFNETGYAGYRDVEVFKDYSGIDRIVKARYGYINN